AASILQEDKENDRKKSQKALECWLSIDGREMMGHVACAFHV
ncbi:unnamed protein product, partial [marine sediment metagenome]